MNIQNIDFLRNDFAAEIILGGKSYPTVEHAYQAAKTVDAAIRSKIAIEPSVQKARGIGRSAPLVSDWEKKRLEVMEALVRQKFFVHKDLQEQLIETGTVPIHMVRDNDYFWGVDDQENGENHLGKILEKVRAEVQLIRGWEEKEQLSDDPAMQLVLDRVEGILDLLNDSMEEDELCNLIGIIDKRKLARAMLDLESAWISLTSPQYLHDEDDQTGSDS